jgi:hypothetical protein
MMMKSGSRVQGRSARIAHSQTSASSILAIERGRGQPGAHVGVHEHVDGLIRFAPLPLTPVSTPGYEAKIAA